jgi:hypothetical protein
LEFLRQTPDAAAEVQQQTGIAENLKLLADFISDVAVEAVRVSFVDWSLN